MTDAPKEPTQNGVARLRTKQDHIILVAYSGTQTECDKQIADKMAEYDAVRDDVGPGAA